VRASSVQDSRARMKENLISVMEKLARVSADFRAERASKISISRWRRDLATRHGAHDRGLHANSMKSIFARPHHFLDAASETHGAPGAITVAETGISLRHCRCRGSDGGDIGNTAIRIARNVRSRMHRDGKGVGKVPVG